MKGQSEQDTCETELVAQQGCGLKVQREKVEHVEGVHGRVSSCLGPLRQSPVLVPCASPVRWSLALVPCGCLTTERPHNFYKNSAISCAGPVRWSRVDASPPNDRRIFVKILRYLALVPCAGPVWMLHRQTIAEFL